MQRARPRPRQKAQDSRRTGLSCGRFGKLQRRQALFAKSQPLYCITSKRRIRNPKSNPAPTPGSIPLRRAPPRRNCKRSAGLVTLDPLNRQHSSCLGAAPLPSGSPTGAVAPLHARSPSRVCVWGGATASTRDRPDSSRNRRSAQTKSRSTRRRSLPRPPGINFPTEFEPRESNGAFGSPWRTLESHFSRPDNRFCAIKADAREPRPGKRTSVESKVI